MIRPVWHFPRHSDADTSETLQSDVMRFIAILALCLVAIFTLVQSLPLRPLAEPEAAQPATETPPPVRIATALPSPEAVNDTVADEIEPILLTAPEPTEEKSTPSPPQTPRETVPQSAPITVRPVDRAQEPKPESLATTAESPRPLFQMPETIPKPSQPAQHRAEARQNASTSAEKERLILRFASDNALLALVAQRRVNVYAWARGAALRLSSERGVLSFAPATAPKHFHSMMPDTVPSAIARALERSAPAARDGGVTGGVTLPADTQGQLERLVNQHRNGALIIETNGRVRFQQAG